MAFRSKRFQAAVATIFLVCSGSDARAQWLPGGLAVPGAGYGWAQLPVIDGAGGLFVVWKDERAYATNSEDVYTQHLTLAADVFPGFPTEGIPIITNPTYDGLASATPDGVGGLVITWLDDRDHSGDWPLYAQRVTGDGQLSQGWSTSGVPLSLAPTAQQGPAAVPDGFGGMYFAWDDIRSGGVDVYSQHLTAAGTVASGWPLSGIPIATGPGNQQSAALNAAITDGAGGLLIAWTSDLAGAVGSYMKHLLPDGSSDPAWPVTGVMVSQHGVWDMAPAPGGGAYLALVAPSPNYPGFPGTSYLLRVLSTGQIAPGWTPDGTMICDFPNGPITQPEITSDAAGHVFAAWYDYRNANAGAYCTEMLPNGSFAPGYALNGVPLSTLPGNEYPYDILPDDAGGFYVSYVFELQSRYVFVQHFGSNGAPALGWDADGQQLNPQGSQDNPRMASDGAGGVFVVWQNSIQGGLYAQHVPFDLPTAVQLSLLSSVADAHHVTLTWSSPTAATLTASVERRGESSAWQAIGTPTAEGTDRLKFEDRSVAAGTRYGYRLSYLDGTSRQYTSETWINVPLGAVLALEGARPNPAVNHLSAAFSLADDAPASLALLDIMGREVSRREVGSMGAGHHVVPLDEGVRTPPGLYWIRLTQGARSLMARAVVIR